MVNDFIPENALQEKYQLEFISTFWRNISLSLEELVPVISIRIIIFRGGLVFVTAFFFLF